MLEEVFNIYLWKGNVHKDMDNITEALKDYTQAIEIDPNFSNAYNGRGNDLNNN